MNHADYVEQLKAIALKMSLESAFSFLVSKISFLAFGPVAYILKRLLEYGIMFLLNKTELGLFFLYTDMRIGKQSEDFTKAIKKNIETQKSGSQEEKQIAEKHLKDSFRDFVKLTS